MSLATLTTTTSMSEARQIKEKLAAAGIEASLPEEAAATDTGKLAASLDGIAVKVKAGDVEAAKKIVAELQSFDPASLQSGGGASAGLPQPLLIGLAAIAVAAVLAWLVLG